MKKEELIQFFEEVLRTSDPVKFYYLDHDFTTQDGLAENEVVCNFWITEFNRVNPSQCDEIYRESAVIDKRIPFEDLKYELYSRLLRILPAAIHKLHEDFRFKWSFEKTIDNPQKRKAIVREAGKNVDSEFISNQNVNPKNLNKILIVDVDTSLPDDDAIKVYNLSSMEGRERSSSEDIDPRLDICALALGLSSMIRSAEKKGYYKSGKGMEAAIALMGEYYADPKH